MQSNFNPDAHYLAIEQQYYRELDEQHQYEVALDQWVKGEIDFKPEQPFTVFI
jgi:hypothetical protein|tara:strand:- start:623 stop:781 length:159 start_codon:yes stop_codon:yes gene_type:complete